jgi:hypothetical protein
MLSEDDEELVAGEFGEGVGAGIGLFSSVSSDKAGDASGCAIDNASLSLPVPHDPIPIKTMKKTMN